MSIGTKRVMWRVLLFALAGLLTEVFFTAFGRLTNGHWTMHGHVSPWMMLDYGLLGVVLMPMARPMIRRRIPLVFRAVVYMLGIFFVEFVSGWIFDLFGMKIWGYSHLPLNLCGYITLTYAPFWYFAGLVVELLYKKFDAMAVVLAKKLTADQLEDIG